MTTLKIGIMSFEDMKKRGGRIYPHVQYADVALDLPLARKRDEAAAKISTKVYYLT